VEAAKAARAEVLRAIRAVGGELDEAVAMLSDHDQTMRKAADAAAAAVHDDIDLAVKELEDQLITIPMDPGSPDVASPESGTGPTPITTARDVAESVSSESDDTESDDTETVDTESDDTEIRAVEPVETEQSNAPNGAEDGAEDGDDEDDETQMASVHDLFEKLRSEEPPTPEDVHPGGGGSRAIGGHKDHHQGGVPTASMGALGVATLTEVPDVDAPAEESSGDVGSPSEVAHSAGTSSPDETSAPEVGGVEAPLDLTGDAALVGAAQDPQADAGADTGQDNGLQTVLDRRDEMLEPAEKLLGRALKRLLSDEQNEVLDRVRRHKRSRIEVADLLGEQDVVEVFTSKLSDAYATAAVAGAKMWAELSGDDPAEPKEIDTTDALVTDSLASQVDELLGLRRAQLREVLEAHSEAGADPSELVDRLRSAYRDLRTSSVDELAGDLATGGFAAGTAVAAGPSAMWRWVPDNGGLPCADAEDNALEGPVVCGAAFPTGDARPPAHPGCRCVVVPAEVEVHS
jgi:hypothetical protein